MENIIDIEKIRQERDIKKLIDFSILNIDKPCGPTCFDVDSHIKHKLNARKTSHFGTLDPLVTGVLPVAINRACRLTGFFMKKDKTYIGEMQVHEDIDIKYLKEIAKEFVGKIIQLPPVKSRVKRVERQREVYRFEILKQINKRNFEFIVECEAGTYIRKLIHDLGEKINGAHMTKLRRTKAGIFYEKDNNLISLKEFDKAVEDYENGDEKKLRNILIPGEIIKEIYPAVFIERDFYKKLKNGSPVFKDYLIEKEYKKIENLRENDSFCIFINDKFLGIYKKTQRFLGQPEFVLN